MTCNVMNITACRTSPMISHMRITCHTTSACHHISYYCCISLLLFGRLIISYYYRPPYYTIISSSTHHPSSYQITSLNIYNNNNDDNDTHDAIDIAAMFAWLNTITGTSISLTASMCVGSPSLVCFSFIMRSRFLFYADPYPIVFPTQHNTSILSSLFKDIGAETRDLATAAAKAAAVVVWHHVVRDMWHLLPSLRLHHHYIIHHCRHQLRPAVEEQQRRHAFTAVQHH